MQKLEHKSNGNPRPSKFLEGSMNDRISKKPPSPYLGENEVMDEYGASQSTSTRASVDTGTIYDAGIESNKTSTVSQFGRRLANAIKPVSAWRIFNAKWKEKENKSPDPELAARRELQRKAEEKYAELKRSGFRGTQGTAKLSTTDVTPPLSGELTDSSRPTSFRDSAIDLEEYRISVDHSQNPRLSVESQGLMPAPNVPLVGRSLSPMPNTSGRRSSLNLRTPSFQTLKKATSQIQLPSAKRLSAQPDTSESLLQVRKSPSKKDLAKQQKLSKRVSNLESQLETARRELELSLSNAPSAEPVKKSARKAFTPGALPSLPSERILKAHVDEDDVENDKLG